MPREIRSIDDLKRPELEALRADSRVKGRALVLNLITLMMFLSTIVFGVLIAVGLFPREQHEGFEPWVVLVGVAVLELPVMYFIVNMHLARMAKAQDLVQATAAGQVAYILGLAFAESIPIYALVGSNLGMPQNAQLGLWSFGMVVMIGVVYWVRPRLMNKLILLLANEKRAAAADK